LQGGKRWLDGADRNKLVETFAMEPDGREMEGRYSQEPGFDIFVSDLWNSFRNGQGFDRELSGRTSMHSNGGRSLRLPVQCDFDFAYAGSAFTEQEAPRFCDGICKQLVGYDGVVAGVPILMRRCVRQFRDLDACDLAGSTRKVACSDLCQAPT
jgi:hypothetical protein